MEWPKGPRVQVLVDWEKAPHDETTWEDLEELVKVFPEFDLEGKVIVEGGVVVTNPNPQVLDLSPLTSGVSPAAIANSNTAEELSMSPLEENVGPREKRKRRAPFWVKDYYTN